MHENRKVSCLHYEKISYSYIIFYTFSQTNSKNYDFKIIILHCYIQIGKLSTFMHDFLHVNSNIYFYIIIFYLYLKTKIQLILNRIYIFIKMVKVYKFHIFIFYFILYFIFLHKTLKSSTFNQQFCIK